MAASISVASLLVGAPAFAEGSEPTAGNGTDSSTVAATKADRVIFKLDQTLGGQHGVAARSVNTPNGVTTSPATAIPADEQPKAGETVLVEYADANVVHASASAGCTISSTAGKPWITTSPRRVYADVTYQQSSGCTGWIQAAGRLYMYWGFEWYIYAGIKQTPPVNGVKYLFSLVWTCNNANSSPFHSTAENSYTGGTGLYIINISPDVNLACGR